MISLSQMNELKQKSKCFSTNLLHFLSGVVIGFTLWSQLTSFRYQWKENTFCSNGFENNQQIDDKNEVLKQLIEDIRNQSSDESLVLIGVMTAKKYLDSRALSIFNTWAKDLNGRVIFFSSSSSSSSYDLPLVSLPTVDDSYPPQKKSFLMLKFMSDHFIDRYEFFMRADDDVYVNTQKLRQFLLSVNSSKPQFIGQAGVGITQERGQLNLNFDENFCMGGPGIVMSRVTLRLFAKNVKYCLKHLYSTHEDVEIGRCVQLSAGIPCTWSYEMQNLFHHNSGIESGLQKGTISSKELSNAITIHPIKSSLIMKRLDLYFKNFEHQKTRHELNLLYRSLYQTIRSLNISSDDYFKSSPLEQSIDFNTLSKRNSDIEWDFVKNNIYSSTNINPKRHIESHIWRSIDNNIANIMALINRGSKQKGRSMEFKNLFYGYIRVDPLVGIEFILDLLMVYKRYRGHKMTIPVRRHAYAVQTFSRMQIREVENRMASQVVNIIVPLSGRIEAFIRFIDNFKEVQIKDKYMTLAVVLFPDSALNVKQLNELKSILNEVQNSGIPLKVAQLGGLFSRAAALQRGSTLFPKEALLLFLDVDMHFTNDVITRVRLNTIHTKQIYFPIVFSQYSPQFVPKNQLNNIDISESRGYWRQFGFGIVSLYNSDLQAVGGFNVSIQGWGMEDVDLYDRIIDSNFTIFRSIDKDLVHIYHDIHCDHSLTSIQRHMCLGTKLTSLGDVRQLSKHISDNKFIYT